MSTSRTAGSQFLCWLKGLRSVGHVVCAVTANAAFPVVIDPKTGEAEINGRSRFVNAVLIDHGDGTGELYCDYDDRVP